ncbi:RNA-guided endonuclease InsQ/TnpB family protein [Microseira wollei]|uniref:Transposase, IS605 OrfB family protein n=1 Tax=Microseira wollei NIES-4236 TaxID=2530354 RepID=A0AAV3XD93_9CYAN|nr:transposase [Microseira wollei]GET39388.1 transposase, IS605 OrfB family protein [Microseira wollei NIES-4236]
MRNVVKVRLYPTDDQKQALAKAFGSVRWVWNYCLALNNETYKATGKGISGMDLKKQLPLLKKHKETEWLKETYSQCLQQAVLNLSQAFVNFFEKRACYPRFKSRHGKQSLHYPANVKIVEGAVKFPFLGKIRANLHRKFDGQLKTVTLAKTKTDKYYASLLFEDERPYTVVSSQGKAIGIDLGLTYFCITSDASKYDNPRHFKKHERNLKRKQRKLSRKQKGSNSRSRARKLVARAHEKISNSHLDFLHKLSRKIVNENQVIVSENLNVKGMVKNHNLAKAISDCGWSMFLNFIDYKAKRDGKTFLEIDRFFPSSKTCNVCLHIVDSLPLDIRSWECPHCHTKHDRDVNAAINIRDEGLRLLASGTGATADGGNVRPKRGRKSSVAAVPREVRSLHSP